MAENNIKTLWKNAIGDTPEKKLYFFLFVQNGFDSIETLRNTPKQKNVPSTPVRLSFMRRLFESVRRFWKRLTGQRWEKNESYEMRSVTDFPLENKDPFYELLEHANPSMKTLYTLHQKISHKPEEQEILQQYAHTKPPFVDSDRKIASQVEHLQLIEKIYKLIQINKTSDQDIDQSADPEIQSKIQDDLYRILLLPNSKQKEAWQTYLEANLNLQDNSVQLDRKLQDCLDPIILKHPGTSFCEALLAIGQSREASAEAKWQASAEAKWQALAEAKKLASTCAQDFLKQFSESKLGNASSKNKHTRADRNSPWDAMLSSKYFDRQSMEQGMQDLLEHRIKQDNVDPKLFAQELINQVESDYSRILNSQKFYGDITSRQEKKYLELSEGSEEPLVLVHNQLIAPQQLINAAQAIVTKYNESVRLQPRSRR